MPAGKAMVIVLVAAAFGMIFNSSGVLHLALGMDDGLTKSVAVGVMRPVNNVAHGLWLDKPKAALDRVFGHDLDATGGSTLANGADAILQGETGAHPDTAPAEPNIVSPTYVDPLRVVVMGDSLSTYIGQQIDDIASKRRLIKVKQVFRDGTGINAPEFFNWQAAAVNEATRAKAQTVIMVLGGNDAQTMTHNGVELRPRTDGWETEYARRVAVIMKSLIDAGVQRVYWSGPPAARSDSWNTTYRRINAAVARATAAVPGARFVDLYNISANPGASPGTYEDYATINGKRVRARQTDGIQWTYAGSRQPAELITTALQRDYGNIL